MSPSITALAKQEIKDAWLVMMAEHCPHLERLRTFAISAVETLHQYCRRFANRVRGRFPYGGSDSRHGDVRYAQ